MDQVGVEGRECLDVQAQFSLDARHKVHDHDIRLGHQLLKDGIALGLRVVERPMQNFLPLPDGDSFSAGPTAADTIEEVRRFSVRDAARLPAFNEMLGRAVALLRDLLHRTPPTDLRRGRDLWEALRFGHGLRALPLTAQRELLLRKPHLR
jgi:phytoene dehydrogenase-like protein